MTKRQTQKVARAMNRCRLVVLEALQTMTQQERNEEESQYGLATTADQLYHALNQLD